MLSLYSALVIRLHPLTKFPVMTVVPSSRLHSELCNAARAPAMPPGHLGSLCPCASAYGCAPAVPKAVSVFGAVQC